MTVIKGAYRKDMRVCCFPQGQERPEGQLERFPVEPEKWLRNLTQEAGFEGMYPESIRDYFLSERPDIPFRHGGCPRGSLGCCGSCSRICVNRCPQDVMFRAQLLVASIEYSPEENYHRASLTARMIYDELHSETPRYFAIAAMVQEHLSAFFNPRLREIIIHDYQGYDTPERIDYAPSIEYERSKSGKLRPIADPTTGTVRINNWPSSGLCPFCLPASLSRRSPGRSAHSKSSKPSK